MQNNNNKIFTLSDGSKVEDLTDWGKLAALTDEQVMAAALADPDAQPVTEAEFREFQRLPQVPGGSFIDRVRAMKENKVPLSVRYDADIVAFFKKQGKGYQRLMNNVLRAYMESKLLRT